MSEVADPRVGRTLDDRYTITRRIADGGMASVYQATDSRLERTVAIKIIHSQLAQGAHRDQFLHRFHSEAKAAAAIVNPHIVQVYDTGEFDNLQYIVMEYVHGVNLRQAMEDSPTFSVRDTLRILGETLDGLASAHQAGLVHRDIKPENILLNSRGHVEITDFGLAKAISDATMATTGLLLGTASYLAPEMIESSTASPQTDIYSVGIMGYEMLAGKVPFSSDNPISMVFKHVHDDVPSLSTVADFPKPIVDFIATLSARDPRQRPADATQAIADLNSAANKLSDQQLFFEYAPKDSNAALKGAAALAGGAAASAAAGLAGANSAQAAQRQEVRSSQAAGQSDLTSQIVQPATSQNEVTQKLLHSSGTPVVTKTVQQQSGSTSVMPSNGHDNGAAGLPPVPPETGGKSGKPSRKRLTKRAKIVIGVVSAVVVVLAAALLWLFLWGPGSYWVVPEASDKPCSQQSGDCSLKGADFAEYQKTLDALGIDYSSVEKNSDTVEAGDIISSNPSVNAHVSRRGGKLQIVVSKGVKKVSVPANLLDCSETPKAESSLKQLGFTKLNIKHEYSEKVDQGCAISFSADPGTTLNHNAAETLVVSNGPKPVTIPGLAGVPQTDAQAQLEDLKLHVTVKEEFSDSIGKGSVISTDPAQGQTAHWGDDITLTVSKGPETAVVPDVVGMKTDEAQQKIEALGFKVKLNKTASVFNAVLSQDPRGNATVPLRDSTGNPTVITLTIV